MISNNTENIITNTIEMSDLQQEENHTLEPNTYYIGDNLDLFKKVKPNSINCIYFDPPYNTGRNFFNFDDRFKSISDYTKYNYYDLQRLVSRDPH